MMNVKIAIERIKKKTKNLRTWEGVGRELGAKPSKILASLASI